MANKGIIAEWELDAILTKRGYHVQRMAASHGLYDLQVDDYQHRKQYRIECKTTQEKAYYPKPEARLAIASLVNSCVTMRCNAILAVRWGGNHGAGVKAEWELFPANRVLEDVARKGEGFAINAIFPGVF
jgi:Holliday junction resolvase